MGSEPVIGLLKHPDFNPVAGADSFRRERGDDFSLEKQCIPLDRDLWHVDRYDDFLKERCRLLAASANSFLGKN